MACTDPVARRGLLPYAMADGDESSAIEFEAHLLVCPRCLRDLRCLDRARALIEEFRPQS